MQSESPATNQPGLKGEIDVREPSRAGRTIARRTAETRATVPDVELGLEVDIDGALELARDRHCSLRAILVRACALSLRRHPLANAAYRDGRYETYSRINIGVTLQTEEGYVTPTLSDADQRSLEELDSELETLRARARAGDLTSPEMAGATFTLIDLGEHGVTWASALITPPQAACLATGAVRAVPVLREQRVVPGHTLGLTLGADGRILFGERAASFLAEVGDRLARAQL